MADFNAVLQIDPENKAARQQLVVASNKVREQQLKEKQAYAGMFDKLAKMDVQKVRCHRWNGVAVDWVIQNFHGNFLADLGLAGFSLILFVHERESLEITVAVLFVSYLSVTFSWHCCVLLCH